MNPVYDETISLASKAVKFEFFKAALVTKRKLRNNNKNYRLIANLELDTQRGAQQKTVQIVLQVLCGTYILFQTLV